MELRKQIQQAINSTSAEDGSNTPDFILAEYLTDCLAAFDKAVTWREKWYGRAPVPVPPEDCPAAPETVVEHGRPWPKASSVT